EVLLNRIEALDGELHAWVYLDRDAVLAEADALDSEAEARRLRGPLHGVPIGVKDIYNVAGVPTRAGSRALAAAQPAVVDSAPVAALRRAGALIVGKTATTEFAYAQPALTRNPWNLDHEPGGSSSGSAAAVAAGMVPAALGSQTAGSVLRPAAFCGVVGFKPSFGRIDRRGVIPFAWSLDTMGTMTRTVRDARLLLTALTSPTWHQAATARAAAAPHIGYVPRVLHGRIDPRMSAAIAEAAGTFERAGATVAEVQLPADFAAAVEAHQVIMVSEGAAHHADGVAAHGEL
ncbi:MAG: amidase, partial [Dehalococcoidia bacterium]